MPTISVAGTLRAGGRKDRRHLLLWHLLFGLGDPVGLGRRGRLGNELSTITFSDTCFAVGINLALVVVVDTGTCGHAFVVGVVRTREFAVELKLRGSMLPLLTEIVQG